jgi:hypothetical protein
MNHRLTWIAIGLVCVLSIITGCSGSGGSGNKSDEASIDTTVEAQEKDEEEIPSQYTKGNIAVSFMEASHAKISKLGTSAPIKAYMYKEQDPMTESDVTALKSKLSSHLDTKFAEDTSPDSFSHGSSSDHRKASILFKSAESEERQALKVNPYSKGFVYHSSQAKYLIPEAGPENVSGKPQALLTRSNAPEFALAYLKNMDLIPKNQYGQLTVGKVSGIGVAGEDNPRIFTVYFIRELDGYPVAGNTRIVVSMTADGKLVSLIHKWPELEETVDENEIDHDPENNNGLVKGNHAVDRIGDLLNNYHNETKVDSIDIRNTELVMYDDGKYIEPVLFASGDVNLKSGDAVEYDWIIPILKNPKGNYEVGDGLSQPPSSNDVDETPVSDPIPDPANSDSGNAE